MTRPTYQELVEGLRKASGEIDEALGLPLAELHARHNLDGALDDLKLGTNDKVVRRTIERVAGQIAQTEISADFLRSLLSRADEADAAPAPGASQ